MRKANQIQEVKSKIRGFNLSQLVNIKVSIEQWTTLLDIYLEGQLNNEGTDYETIDKLIDVLYREKATYYDISRALNKSGLDEKKDVEIDLILKEHILNNLCARKVDLFLNEDLDEEEYKKRYDALQKLFIDQSMRVNSGDQVDHTRDVLEFLDRRENKKVVDFLTDKKESEDISLVCSMRFFMFIKNRPNLLKELNDNLVKGDESICIAEIEKKFPDLDYIHSRIILSNIKFALAMDNPEYTQVKEILLNGNKDMLKNLTESVSKGFYRSISDYEKGEESKPEGERNDRYFKRRNLQEDEIKKVRKKASKRFIEIYVDLSRRPDLLVEYGRNFDNVEKNDEIKDYDKLVRFRELVKHIESSRVHYRKAYSAREYADSKRNRTDDEGEKNEL